MKYFLNPHRDFIRFFLGLAVLGLITETWDFYKNFLLRSIPWTLEGIPFYFQIWFYGLRLRSWFIEIDLMGAYASIIVIVLCLAALKIMKTGPSYHE
mgnify:CR=1 FL=1